MKKKNIIILIILLPLFIFTIYKLIILFKFNNLEKYNFIDNEIVIKEVKYNNKNYIISRYYNNSSSWSNLNILLNSNNAYYILKNIEKCDTLDNASNIHIKDNEIYTAYCDIEVKQLNLKEKVLNFYEQNKIIILISASILILVIVIVLTLIKKNKHKKGKQNKKNSTPKRKK